jgi:dihydroorotate dehydrogenase (fumarate)
MSDLSVRYLGLNLSNPVVVSASPLCEDIENIRRMEDAGAAAVVLHSLFEEQLTLESLQLDRSMSHGSDSNPEGLSFLPEMARYNLGPDGYLDHIRKAKKAVSIPIIASLNGASRGGWVKYARKIQEAGADALELNIYLIPTKLDQTGWQVEQIYIDLVQSIRAQIDIPLAVKLSPYFSSLASMALQLADAGADGIVIFNRFYQPDFDLENLDVFPSLTLSNSNELLLRLHWAAILYGTIKADIAITGGIHTGKDVIKSMMAGARVAMMTSALLKYGILHISSVLEDIQAFMQENEYESVLQMQGSLSRRSVKNSINFERTNYMRVLSSYTPRHR